jgi:hypothetical protein
MKTNNLIKQVLIRRLVLSGGGIWGFSCYGALRESAKANFWNIDNIVSIHATSVGSMLAVMMALKYEWDVLDDFLIKRPWHQIFKFDLYSIISSVEKRGIFDKKCINDMFEPLFSGKDISLNVTMKDFYDKTGIELHFFSVQMNNNFCKVDFSHKSHPEWQLLDVVYCSCCLPILFSPFLHTLPPAFLQVKLDKNENDNPMHTTDEVFQTKQSTSNGLEQNTPQEDTKAKSPLENGVEAGDCYIDGGVLNNYPLIQCVEQCLDESDKKEDEIDETDETEENDDNNEKNNQLEKTREIFGIKKTNTNKQKTVNTSSTLFDYILLFLGKIISIINTNNSKIQIVNQLNIPAESTNIYDVYLATSSQEERKRLVEYGSHCWKIKETDLIIT